VAQDVFNEEFKLRRKSTQWTKDEDPNKILTEGIKSCVPVYHERAQRFEPLYIEERIKVEFPEVNGTITGTIDLVTKNHLIRDLKTRRRAPNWLDPIKSMQKTVYTIGYMEKFKKKPKAFVLDSLIRKANPEFLTSDPQIVTDEQILQWRRLIVKVITSIRMGLFFPKEEGNMFCSPNMCGYWDICHKGDWMKLPSHGKTFMENTPAKVKLTEDEEEEE
jgi:hypothetical protein